MKKNLLITIAAFIITAVFSFSGCSKNDEPATPPTPNYELRFTNTSQNPYLIEVNGTSNVISGNTFKSYTLPKGTYAWKVTQQSGYILYPTIKDGTVNLDQDKEIVFP